MTPKERQKRIVEYLDYHNVCTYEKLADILKVSSMTIRRDVDKLVAHDAIIKALGCVQRANAPSGFYESRLEPRLSLHTREKRAIAEEALKYIREGETIFLDGSTTCLEFARLLVKHVEQLTIITNSFLICSELAQNKDNIILMIGGRYDPESFCCGGVNSEHQIKQFFVDKAFVSTTGFLPEDGTYESSIGLIKVKQMMAKHSNSVVLLADYSKFGQKALCKALDISQIRTVITDTNVSEEIVSLLKNAGHDIIVASADLCGMEL